MFDVILLQVVHQVSPIALQGKGAGLFRGQGAGLRLERSQEGRDRREQTGKEVGIARGSKSGRRKGDWQRKGSLWGEKRRMLDF